MSRRFSHVSVLVTTLVLVLVASAAQPFRAQPAAQDPDTLSALLIEVKGLRAAMEQMASSGPRVQLVFGRLQIHEQRINSLVRRLDTVREKIRPAMQEEESLRTRVAQFEAVTARGGGSAEFQEERRHIEAQLPALKKLASRAALDLQQLQTEETALASDIAAEQARWVQINQQLEELERSLARR